MHAIAGEEFGDSKGCTAEIIKILHGMSASSRSFALCLGDFIRTLGCVPSRADPDTWMKNYPNCDGLSFITTHVNYFLIIGIDPETIIEVLRSEFYM